MYSGNVSIGSSYNLPFYFDAGTATNNIFKNILDYNNYWYQTICLMEMATGILYYLKHVRLFKIL